MKAKVAVVTLGELGLGWNSSGAEVIADTLCQGLSARFDIVSVFGVVGDAHIQRSSERRANAYRAIPGFCLDASVVAGGVLTTGQLTPVARHAIEQADVVLQFERVVERFFPGASVAVLGSIAYEHCRTVAASPYWDVLVVPSPFVLKTVRDQWSMHETNIRVVANGIDLDLFTPGRPPMHRCGETARLILPGRPEWGKGYLEALRLLEDLEEAGIHTELHCFEYSGFLNVGGFYDELRSQFSKVELRLNSWQPRRAMPDQYRMSTATFCLGATPEGFGLTAVESLACGVPVIYNPVGHLASLMPANCGGCTLDDFRTRWSRRRNPLEVLYGLTKECHEGGLDFIHKHFSQQRMIDGYAQILDSLV